MSGAASNRRKDAQIERLRVGPSKRWLRYLDAHGKDKYIKNAGTIKRKAPKVGRNEPCPCGQTVDGKPVKFKNCCGG